MIKWIYSRIRKQFGDRLFKPGTRLDDGRIYEHVIGGYVFMLDDDEAVIINGGFECLAFDFLSIAISVIKTISNVIKI